jgi:hypothetical protein
MTPHLKVNSISHSNVWEGLAEFSSSSLDWSEHVDHVEESDEKLLEDIERC